MQHSLWKCYSIGTLVLIWYANTGNAMENKTLSMIYFSKIKTEKGIFCPKKASISLKESPQTITIIPPNSRSPIQIRRMGENNHTEINYKNIQELSYFTFPSNQCWVAVTNLFNGIDIIFANTTQKIKSLFFYETTGIKKSINFKDYRGWFSLNWISTNEKGTKQHLIIYNPIGKMVFDKNFSPSQLSLFTFSSDYAVYVEKENKQRTKIVFHHLASNETLSRLEPKKVVLLQNHIADPYLFTLVYAQSEEIIFFRLDPKEPKIIDEWKVNLNLPDQEKSKKYITDCFFSNCGTLLIAAISDSSVRVFRLSKNYKTLLNGVCTLLKERKENVGLPACCFSKNDLLLALATEPRHEFGSPKIIVLKRTETYFNNLIKGLQTRTVDTVFPF